MEVKNGKRLVFDIMVGERFIATERMPITIDVILGYDGDEPIYDERKIYEYVLKRRPTLRHVNFDIYYYNAFKKNL